MIHSIPKSLRYSANNALADNLQIACGRHVDSDDAIVPNRHRFGSDRVASYFSVTTPRFHQRFIGARPAITAARFSSPNLGFISVPSRCM